MTKENRKYLRDMLNELEALTTQLKVFYFEGGCGDSTVARAYLEIAAGNMTEAGAGIYDVLTHMKED